MSQSSFAYNIQKNQGQRFQCFQLYGQLLMLLISYCICRPSIERSPWKILTIPFCQEALTIRKARTDFLGLWNICVFYHMWDFLPFRSLSNHRPNILKTKPRKRLCSRSISFSQLGFYPVILSLCRSVPSGKAIKSVIHDYFLFEC